jgi:hypothetical protein
MLAKRVSAQYCDWLKLAVQAVWSELVSAEFPV